MDGNIDYSRMVEVDRPSYRTIHRSYGRSYPPNPPRHPRPRHRPVDSHAASALPGDVDSHMLSRHGSVPVPPHPPWINHVRDQGESSSSEQSAGVSSVTSIVQMHVAGSFREGSA
ncbi:hypothetical protein NKR19_g967 [Coniochaeta hoffmannii]|uniref:Uncharacterized protein n=1 Tax=Coniochaeta hoffmannii TaxID=91930 RepID=A0AA38VPL9_9PEZI|nr:hypothetical protein NKR19_g967 [Coniochaeta hoffmannii]